MPPLPNCANPCGWIPHDPWANFNLGIILSNEGQTFAARDLFEAAVQADPEFSTAHFNLANAQYKMGQFNPAIASWRRTIALNRSHAWAHFNLGYALRKRGDLEAGRVEIQEAMRIDPSIAGRTFPMLDAINDEK